MIGREKKKTSHTYTQTVREKEAEKEREGTKKALFKPFISMFHLLFYNNTFPVEVQ